MLQYPSIIKDTNICMQPWRLELFFKGSPAKCVVELLRSGVISHINIPHKSKGDDLIKAVDDVISVCPGLKSVCLHYSLKNAYGGSSEAAMNKLQQILQALEGHEHPSISLLLVSGGGPKRRLNSVSALLQLAERGCSIPIYVAFNPYEIKINQERLRLEEKVLKTNNLVKGIYLQAGDNVEQLQQGLCFIKKLNVQRKHLGLEPLVVLGSIFYPTKQFLTQMKFRPWHGVSLSEDYLGSVHGAQRRTCAVLDVFRKHGVAPLIESPLQNKHELDKVIERYSLQYE